LIDLQKKIFTKLKFNIPYKKSFLTNLMLTKQFATLNRALFTYGFASQKIKVKNPVAELDGD